MQTDPSKDNCFSKKVLNHWMVLKLTVYQFNNKLSYSVSAEVSGSM